MNVLMFMFGILLTVVLLMKLGHRGGSPQLGSMSPAWIVAFYRSQHASSM